MLYGGLECPVSVSVVMSRPEARSASNSARLLALWLPGVELHVRGGPGDAAEPEGLSARPDSALLFPGAGEPEPLPAGVRHLIVPDGTWSQARRIERRWFAGRGLPRVALSGPWPSVYALRRQREACSPGGSRGDSGGLCTFEAVAIALGLLHDRSLAATLLERFAEWARRARALKAGGASGVPARREGAALEHPAARVLGGLPAGTADAGLSVDAALG